MIEALAHPDCGDFHHPGMPMRQASAALQHVRRHGVRYADEYPDRRGARWAAVCWSCAWQIMPESIWRALAVSVLFFAVLHPIVVYASTSLNDSAKQGDADTVRALLEAGADPNVANKGGFTPLYWATRAGHVDVVTVLLEAGADPNVANKGGFTPLYWATRARTPGHRHRPSRSWRRPEYGN